MNKLEPIEYIRREVSKVNEDILANPKNNELRTEISLEHLLKFFDSTDKSIGYIANYFIEYIDTNHKGQSLVVPKCGPWQLNKSLEEQSEETIAQIAVMLGWRNAKIEQEILEAMLPNTLNGDYPSRKQVEKILQLIIEGKVPHISIKY